MPSFDVVSQVNMAELDNALAQAKNVVVITDVLLRIRSHKVHDVDVDVAYHVVIRLAVLTGGRLRMQDDDDNRIINHNPDTQDDRKECQQIDRKSHGCHAREGTDNRDRHSRRGHKRRAPVLQKQHND